LFLFWYKTTTKSKWKKQRIGKRQNRIDQSGKWKRKAIFQLFVAEKWL